MIPSAHEMESLIKELYALAGKEIWVFILIGFTAQLIDGVVGMGYGLTCSSFLLLKGVHPAAMSASVHLAEIFSGGATALSHLIFRNLKKELFRLLLLPGIAGSVAGAIVLKNVDVSIIKPLVHLYLIIIGAFLLVQKSSSIRTINAFKIRIIGFAGGFFDAAGGGGWGPMVNGNLIGQAEQPKTVIATTCAVEFFISLSAVVVLFGSLGRQQIVAIAGLIAGGLVAAPFAAFLVGRLKGEILKKGVSVAILITSMAGLVKYFYSF